MSVDRVRFQLWAECDAPNQGDEEMQGRELLLEGVDGEELLRHHIPAMPFELENLHDAIAKNTGTRELYEATGMHMNPAYATAYNTYGIKIENLNQVLQAHMPFAAFQAVAEAVQAHLEAGQEAVFHGPSIPYKVENAEGVMRLRVAFGDELVELVKMLRA